MKDTWKVRLTEICRMERISKNPIFQERKTFMEAIMLSHDQPLIISKNVNKFKESIISI